MLSRMGRPPEPDAAKGRPSRMHGTLDRTKLIAARQRSIKARIIALATLAVLAGIVAGAALVYTAQGNDLLIFLGFTEPKDCG
jgi:hypothetical protein